VRLLRLDCRFRLGILAMTGPWPAGRPWTQAEVAQLHELIASGVKVGLIARKLKHSPGAIYTSICSFKKTPRDLTFGAQRPSLPSERLAFAHADAQSSEIEDSGRWFDLGLKPKK
jgi:hypothetical protein